MLQRNPPAETEGLISFYKKGSFKFFQKKVAEHENTAPHEKLQYCYLLLRPVKPTILLIRQVKSTILHLSDRRNGQKSTEILQLSNIRHSDVRIKPTPRATGVSFEFLTVCSNCFKFQIERSTVEFNQRIHTCHFKP